MEWQFVGITVIMLQTVVPSHKSIIKNKNKRKPKTVDKKILNPENQTYKYGNIRSLY